jgi:hypothetical protein
MKNRGHRTEFFFFHRVRRKEENTSVACSEPGSQPYLGSFRKSCSWKTKPPKNKQELVVALQEEWIKLEVTYLEKLVESMPRRVQAVVESKGNPTRY